MLTSLKIEKIIIKCIWQPQFTYKWISHIYPLCSHTRSYHQLLSDLRPIIVLQCRSLTDSGQTWMVWLWWMKMPTQKLSILMVMFMLPLKTAFPQFVNILMWLSDSLMIAWRQHVQCTALFHQLGQSTIGSLGLWHRFGFSKSIL